MLTLAERFVARGVRCDLVVAISKGQFMDQVPAGVRLFELGKQKTIHATFALSQYLRRENPDALLATTFAANICALLASAITFRKLRTVITESSPSEINFNGGSIIRATSNRLAALLLYRTASNVIAISNGVRSGLLDNHLVSASQIMVIYNPSNVAARCHEELVRQSNLLIACGRLVDVKDYPTLLRAFARVREVFDAKLWILGEGVLQDVLEQQREELGLTDCVTFRGFVQNPARYMREAAIFVHSARFEGFGLVLAEALASGCSIVATDSPGGVREVLADGRYGTLVPVGDDAALADALLRVLRGEVKFPDASEHLRKFDIDHVTNLYLSVLLPPDQKSS